MYAWINWYVPDKRVGHYIFFMVLGLFVFPYLFLGMRFTMFGYLTNLLLLDALYYFMFKVQKKYLDDKDDDGNNSF